MSTKTQILISVVIVSAAVAVTAFLIRSGDDADEQGGMGGHDMSTMGAGGGERSPVVLDAEARRLIGVTFATVERRELPIFVRTVGTVTYDETRLVTVNLKIEGWVERLFVDFTGAPVQEGQPLMEIYSPALVSAQEELVLAARLVRDAGEGRAAVNARVLLESARRRLSYWDIPEEEIRRIEESGEPTKTMTLHAPASGIVVEKNVVEGDRIVPGMTVYRIADLSRVWIDAEVFEKDLGLVRNGQRASVSFETFPGEVFTARVTYIYPTVNMQSRTGRVRLELSNPRLDFKPGMYAKVTLDVPPTGPTLVVPRSAVIQTGERALVFVSGSGGALLPREVTPGRTSGRFMELLAGIEEGERVVSSSAFLVDAESNLGTMTGNMEGESGMEGMDHSGMEGMEMPADTGGAMGAMEMPADTGAAVDHSGHDMGAMDMPPDTGGVADHSNND